MKQARQHKGAHGHSACGNCARTVRVRHDAANVACTVHLQMMPAGHAEDCADYLPFAEKFDAAPNEASTPHKTESPDPETHVDRT